MPSGDTIKGTGTTTTFDSLATGTYTFNVTNSIGCLSTVSASATINAQPTTPNAPITGAITQPSCAIATGSVALSGLPATGTWIITANPGGDTTMGTGTTVIFDSLVPGTYTFTVTNSVGCTSSASASAIVNVQPATPTAPIAGAVTQPTCAVATGSIALSGLPATGTWTVTASPGSLTITGSGTTANFPGLAANTYTFTVTNSAGCTSSASASAIVNTQPTIPTITLTGSTLICQGQTDTVNASGGGTYLWSTGATTATIHDTPNATTNYIVTVTNAAGCSATNNYQVTVNELPTVSLTSDPANFAYVGQVITFTASPSGYTQYTFYVDNTLEQSGSGNTYQTMTLTSGQNVSVVVNDKGCTSPAVSISDFIIKLIPNAFIPDGSDPNNAVFMKGLDLQIVNRWGQELYSGKDGWDGKYKGSLVAPGTYFYIIKLYELNNDVKVINGSITVVQK